MTKLSPYRKAITAALLAVLTWYVTAAADGITHTELAGLLIAVGTAVGVFGVPNGGPSPDDGQSSIDFLIKVLAVILLAVFVWWFLNTVFVTPR